MRNQQENIHNRKGFFTYPTEAQAAHKQVNWDGLRIQAKLLELIRSGQLNPNDSAAVQRAVEQITGQPHLL